MWILFATNIPFYSMYMIIKGTQNYFFGYWGRFLGVGVKLIAMPMVYHISVCVLYLIINYNYRTKMLYRP